MPIICLGNPNNYMTKEPYISFEKEYTQLADQFHDREIELWISATNLTDGFANGFYLSDEYRQNSTRIKFRFVNVKPEQPETSSIFVRATYSFAYDRENMDYYAITLEALSLRREYFFIPNAEYLDVTYKIEKEVQVFIDAIVLNKADVKQVCKSMINQFIAMFGIEN